MLLSDPCFDVPVHIPLAPGTSPFWQKGLVYRGNLDFMNRHVPGGVPAIVRNLPTPELRKFFEQRFEVSQWYDSLPNAYFQQTAAQLRGVPLVEHAQQLGVFHARERLKGFSSLVLKVLSTQSVALWVPRVPSMYYSYAKTHTQIIGPRRVALTVAGVPVMMARWIGAIFAATGGAFIASSGAKDVVAGFSSAEPESSKHEIPVCCLEGLITWK
jgi:hypothetical protein